MKKVSLTQEEIIHVTTSRGAKEMMPKSMHINFFHVDFLQEIGDFFKSGSR